MSKRFALCSAVLLSVALSVYFLGGRWLGSDRSFDMLSERGSIRIGYAVEAPFAFIGEGNRITGESAEVARQVVGELGIAELEWRQMEFRSLFKELEAENIDVVAGGVFITAERAARFAFSRPTARVGYGLLVAEGNPLGLQSYRQAAITGARVAVLGDSVEQALLRALGFPDERMITVPDAGTGRGAVVSGSVDAFAISAPTIRWWAASNRLVGCEAASPFFQPSSGGFPSAGYPAFAFRPADRQLREAWDEVLARYIGSEAHKTLVEPFGIDVEQLPMGMTAKQVLEQQ